MTQPSQPLDIPAARAIDESLPSAPWFVKYVWQGNDRENANYSFCYADTDTFTLKGKDLENLAKLRNAFPEALTALEEERAEVERLRSLRCPSCEAAPKPLLLLCSRCRGICRACIDWMAGEIVRLQGLIDGYAEAKQAWLEADQDGRWNEAHNLNLARAALLSAATPAKEKKS